MQNSSMHDGTVDNGPYQRRMAALILETMSLTEAVQYCLENGWDGVLWIIQHADLSAGQRSSSE
jgi:hypothetical protein